VSESRHRTVSDPGTVVCPSCDVRSIVPFEERDELGLLATLVAGESLSEPWLGKLAVAWTVRNRVDSGHTKWFGSGYHGVMLKPWQFSCFNEKDPVRHRLDDPLTWAGVYWGECYSAACAAYFSLAIDPTDGADHYHTYAVSPNWTHGQPPTIRIGAHLFYKLRD